MYDKNQIDNPTIMKIKEIAKLLDGRILGCQDNFEMEFHKAFSSDLMSDVLKVSFDDTLLITGLCNNQTMRTADMADVSVVIIGRDKRADEEMLELAEDSGITIIESPYSLFKISGILFSVGIMPLY